MVLELGGKDPAIVCRDADLDRAARGIVWGAFVNAGQTCASVERVYVEQAVADAFMARKVVEETRKLRVGDPAPRETDMGPLTLERQRTIVEEHVAGRGGAGRAGPDRRREAPGPGFFYPPTVLADVDHSMRIMREETFGPVLPIMAVESVDEAIRLANDSEYGLTASGWTRDPATARRLQAGLAAGVVTINDCVSSYGEPTAPWGGIKHSGIGRTHGLPACARWCRSSTSPATASRGPGALVVPLRRRSSRAWPCDGEPGAPRAARSGRALRAPSSALSASARFWRARPPGERSSSNVDKLF